MSFEGTEGNGKIALSGFYTRRKRNCNLEFKYFLKQVLLSFIYLMVSYETIPRYVTAK
jgi:hypothetical protein